MGNNSIILIGDSLTFGYGVNKKDSFAFKLKEKFKDITVINKGINGDTTPSMLSRYYNDVLSYNPKKIFIMGGTNDLLCGRSVNSIISNIELMIKEGLEIGASITIGIPPIIIEKMAENLFMPSHFYEYTSSNLPILREEITKLKEKYPFNYVDFYKLTKNHINEEIFLDGIHLNALGNSLLFEHISDVI